MVAFINEEVMNVVFHDRLGKFKKWQCPALELIPCELLVWVYPITSVQIPALLEVSVSSIRKLYLAIQGHLLWYISLHGRVVGPNQKILGLVYYCVLSVLAAGSHGNRLGNPFSISVPLFHNSAFCPVFNLAGREIGLGNPLGLPGHSPGSLCISCSEHKTHYNLPIKPLSNGSSLTKNGVPQRETPTCSNSFLLGLARPH